MAGNNYIVLNSKFKPFSFQEMLAPVAIYDEAYRETETALDSLNILEDLEAELSLNPNDKDLLSTYNSYRNSLKSVENSFYNNGLNSTIKKDLRGLKSKYKEIASLESKIKKRAELAAEQRKLGANSNIRFSKDYRNASLHDISNASTYDVIDLNEIYKNAGNDFGNITSKMYRDDFKPVPIGNTGYSSIKTGYGYTPEQFIEGLTDKNSNIYKFYKERADVIDQRTDLSPELRDEMKAQVLRGMEATSGEFKYQQVRDFSRTSDTTSGTISDDVLNSILENMAPNSNRFIDGVLYYKDANGITSRAGTQQSSSNNTGSETPEINPLPDGTQFNVLEDLNKDEVREYNSILDNKKKNKNTIRVKLASDSMARDYYRFTYDDLTRGFSIIQNYIDSVTEGNGKYYTYYVDSHTNTIIPVVTKHTKGKTSSVNEPADNKPDHSAKKETVPNM